MIIKSLIFNYFDCSTDHIYLQMKPLRILFLIKYIAIQYMARFSFFTHSMKRLDLITAYTQIENSIACLTKGLKI